MKTFILAFVTAVVAFAQIPAAVESGDATAAVDMPLQKIGPDDLLTISVADCPEMTKNFRVLNDGTLALPLLRTRIIAADKTPQEVEVAITSELVRQQFLVQPVVSVSVAEYRSLPVSVLGAVRHPITFQAAGDVNLLDALTRADGLSSDAGPDILVTHHRGLNGKPGLVQRISVKSLIDQADPAVNIPLRGGEEIRVPTAGKVYVVGNVRRSGAFPLQDGESTSVLKIVAVSEGLAPYASKDAYIYRQEAGKSGRNEIPIQLSQIMKRKAPDVSLLPNDILYIPDSSGKRMTAETAKVLTGFGINTMSGLLIWRR